MNVDAAYERCEQITRREAKNFAYGIRLLHRPERRAMSAIYALARRIDDIGDGDASPEAKLVALKEVRQSLDSIDPATTDPVLLALADAQARYDLPMGCFGEIIDGCEMDLRDTRYGTIDDLVTYCRYVAGSVGRLTLAVVGSDDPVRAATLADSLGVALQLTNIVRDVVEDRELGRCYIPAADADRLSCPRDLNAPPATLARVVEYECGRAERWFDEGLQLLPLLHGRGRACVGALSGVYHRLLRRIEADPVAVTRGRVSLPTRQKVAVALTSLVAARS